MVYLLLPGNLRINKNPVIYQLKEHMSRNNRPKDFHRFGRIVFKHLFQQEDGTAAIDFIATIPAVITTALVCAQLLVAMQTIIIVQSAAREGARAAAVGEDFKAAAISSSPMVNPEVSGGRDGDKVRVTVSADIPTFAFPLDLGPATSTAIMRYEPND